MPPKKQQQPQREDPFAHMSYYERKNFEHEIKLRRLEAFKREVDAEMVAKGYSPRYDMKGNKIH